MQLSLDVYLFISAVFKWRISRSIFSFCTHRKKMISKNSSRYCCTRNKFYDMMDHDGIARGFWMWQIKIIFKKKLFTIQKEIKSAFWRMLFLWFLEIFSSFPMDSKHLCERFKTKIIHPRYSKWPAPYPKSLENYLPECRVRLTWGKDSNFEYTRIKPNKRINGYSRLYIFMTEI